ncbi:HD family phosphohydrolase [Anoxybacter fermentans]|nr:HDIG domain-containing metalloprotein [Anoxybacter fermentans]
MSFLLDLKKSFKRIFASEVIQNSKIRRSVLALGIFLSITLIMTIDFIPNAVKLEVGEVARQDIVAPITTTYVDKKKTQEMKQKAAEEVIKVWRTDPAISRKVQNDIRGFFNIIRKYQELEIPPNEISQISGDVSPLTFEEKVKMIQREVDFEISPEEIELALKQDPETLDNLEKYLKELILSYLDKGIQPSYLENIKTKIAMNIENTNYSTPIKGLLTTIADQVVQPNLVLDVEETRRRQEEAMAKVAPVERTIKQGEIIIRSGNVVTEEDIAILEALGLRRPQINFRTISGLIVIIFILMAVTIYYLYQYHPKLFKDENSLLLLGLLSILILIIAKLFTLFRLSNTGYLVPIAAVSILISILLDSMIAIVFTTVLSFLIVIITGGDASVGAVLLVSGITGVFSVSEVSQRSDLVRAGFFVSGAAALTIFAYSLTQPLNWVEVLKFTSWGIINGILAAIMTNGLLPYLENVFGITSAVKLLELANPNQPLLKKLLMEAPGTYHHSILVGNLVEAAADKVGADSLLARVGAYYHDIGKIKRPYFFSDNQFGGENPHDKLSPGLSTLIIKSHVKDGVEMAKKYKLPKPIIDIIQQHHGTNLISFFYQEALKDEKYENVNEDEFRYEGPKPQTREAALIMLADITEAAVRSKGFNRSNHNRIEGLVRELIRKKLEEGQLDECDLTLKDLDKIATSFTKVLTGIYHYRIEYPENIAREMKGVQVVNGDSHK